MNNLKGFSAVSEKEMLDVNGGYDFYDFVDEMHDGITNKIPIIDAGVMRVDINGAHFQFKECKDCPKTSIDIGAIESKKFGVRFKFSYGKIRR